MPVRCEVSNVLSKQTSHYYSSRWCSVRLCLQGAHLDVGATHERGEPKPSTGNAATAEEPRHQGHAALFVEAHLSSTVARDKSSRVKDTRHNPRNLHEGNKTHLSKNS